MAAHLRPHENMSDPVKTTRTIAVIGNPNTGKSTLFNALTGLKQHVGNYPGVTVERKVGTAKLDDKTSVELIDLPGTYSLAARSPDEMIAVDVLLSQMPGSPTIDAILAIADASNPERNFYLISQLLELGLPVVVALNMLDVAETKGLKVDLEKIEHALGCPVVGLCANKGKGLDDLKAALRKALDKGKKPSGSLPQFPKTMDAEIDALHADLNTQAAVIGRPINRLEAFRALVDKGGHAEERLTAKLGATFTASLTERRARASKTPLPAEEVRTRYAWVKAALADAIVRPAQPPATGSDSIDKWVTHWFTGSLIFLVLMFIVFECIFSFANVPMEWIKTVFGAIGKGVASNLREGPFKSLIETGIIKGVGAVLVFLPQICLLFFFIAVMEDCGYMARAAFLMDRLLSRVGLSGKSFIPMLSSFACAVPGIMATRTIENWRDRLTTIIVAPLMSCSARLPVYTLMIYAFIPAESTILFSWLGTRGFVLFCMYFVGIIVAVPVAWILKKTLLKGETPPFLIELPSYKMPDWRGVLFRVWDRAKAFVVRAGTIILAVNIVVWALAYFPHSDEIGNRYTTHRSMLDEQRKARMVFADARLADAARLLSMPKSDGLISAITQSYKYDTIRDEALKALEASDKDEATKKKEAAEIDAKHAESLDALSKVSGIRPIWYQAVEIREARTFKKKEDAEAQANWVEATRLLDGQESAEFLQTSYFARMGKTIEPAFKPLGWDWRISMAALASFPAREVIVATLGTIFGQDGGDEVNAESVSLQKAMQKAEWDRTSASQPRRKLFNIPVALSIMVFFALCSQCAATLATIKRETNSWWWPAFSFTYMTALAYLAAMLTYQIGMKYF